jgi:hypothetical protein
MLLHQVIALAQGQRLGRTLLAAAIPAVFTCGSSALAGMSMEDFAARAYNEERHRFEAVELPHCANGSKPSIQGWNQLSKGTDRYLTFGRADDIAPFIWIGRDFQQKPTIGLSSMVYVDWVDCDEDGNTTEESTGFLFRSLYDIGGDIAAPAINLRGYVASALGQRSEKVVPEGGSALLEDLADFDPFATGKIRGPADEPVLLDTPARLNIEIELTTAESPGSGNPEMSRQIDQFTILFKDGCGSGEPLRVKYSRSECGGRDLPFCEDAPKVTP